MAHRLRSEADRRKGVTVTLRKADRDRLDAYVERIKGQNSFVKVDRQTVLEGLITDFLDKCDKL